MESVSDESTLKSEVKISTNAAKWTLLSVWVKRLLGLVSTLVLVRYLTPTDLGIAISAMIVLMFAQAVTEAGSRQYIIQQDNLNHEQISCAWTISLILKLVASSLIIIASLFADRIFDSEKMASVLLVCSAVPLLIGLKNPGLFIDEKNDQYKTLNILPVISKICALPVTIGIAIVYETYWSLIIGSLLETTIEVLLSYRYNKFTPKLTLIGYKRQLKFSNYFFVMSIFGYLRSRLENFAIIALFGVKGNGLYSIAQEIAFLPMTEIVQPIQRGFHSTAARLKSQKQQMFELYAKQSNWVLLILLPCFFGLLAVQDLFTAVVLGANWVEAGQIMPIFTATTIPFSLYLLIILILTIENKFKYIIAIDVTYSIVLAVTTYYIDHFNLVYFTTYRALLSFVIFGYYLVVIRALYQINILFLLKALPAITFCAGAMYAVIMLLRAQISDISQLLQLLILITSGILIYSSLLYTVCRATYKNNARISEILDIYHAVGNFVNGKLKANSLTKDRE